MFEKTVFRYDQNSPRYQRPGRHGGLFYGSFVSFEEAYGILVSSMLQCVINLACFNIS